MAWNDPGGSGPRDPWGGRGGDQGPPDLDESLRKLQSQLSGIFGRRGGSGGGGGGISLKMYAAVLAALIVGYGVWGIYTLDAQERGVVFRFGKAQDEIKLPGLHWNPPIIDRVEKVVATRINEKSHSALMLTEDENIVDISMTAQYFISDPVSYLVQVNDPDKSVEHAMESALRHVVGSSTMDNVITEGRAALANEVQERLQSYLNIYRTGIQVSALNVDQSGPPEQVQEAFDDVQKAKEDEARFVNEANAYLAKVVPEAHGSAQRQLEEANAYRDRVLARAQGEAERFTKLLKEYNQAKEVTRDRLYIDAIESVLSQSSKIVVDVEGGNNLLYLPLDRLVQGAGAAGSIEESELRRLVNEAVNERLPASRRDSR